MDKFCLKWNDFQANVSKTFSSLRKEQDFYDITLLSDDGEAVSAHKVVLSASSEFFKSVLRKADHSKPMIYLSGVKQKVLSNILDYIYEGEVNVYQEDLDNFLDVAEKLKINGLTGGQDDDKNNPYEKIEGEEEYIQPRKFDTTDSAPETESNDLVIAKPRINRNQEGVQTCAICHFQATTRNPYRHLQDHLALVHFKERIAAELPTKKPYICPEPGCENKQYPDWQAVMRHYIGRRHGVLDRFVEEELARTIQ